MQSQVQKNIIRWGIILVSLFIVSLILWNTFIFFQKFKEEERLKMEILAAAFQRMNTSDLDVDITLENQILDSNLHIPVIITDENDQIVDYIHLDENRVKKEGYLLKKLKVMKAQNHPIIIDYPGARRQYIYYSDSDILTNLKYYPIGLILILMLFSLAIYLYNYSNKIAAQNQLWTGMAKETAHQIGTPLTSMMGWATLLKEDPKNIEIACELEKDIERLEVITHRFSKVGSTPTLSLHNIILQTEESIAYFASRTSKQVTFLFETKHKEIFVMLNPELYSWVLENLVKNALDAMQGRGLLTIRIEETKDTVKLYVIDTGKGISKNMYKKIFSPGITTKKRGWGLGLSLSKRIVEDYHYGKIMVQHSELDKGTTFLVSFPKNN